MDEAGWGGGGTWSAGHRRRWAKRRWRWRQGRGSGWGGGDGGLAGGLVAALVAGLVAGLAVAFVAGLVAGLVTGLVASLVVALVMTLVKALQFALVAAASRALRCEEGPSVHGARQCRGAEEATGRGILNARRAYLSARRGCGHDGRDGHHGHGGARAESGGGGCDDAGGPRGRARGRARRRARGRARGWARIIPGGAEMRRRPRTRMGARVDGGRCAA